MFAGWYYDRRWHSAERQEAMPGMKRREFITLLGGAAAWPLSAHAQQPGKLPIIGFLGGATASTWRLWVDAFVLRLRELGWIEGRSVAIEYRWAEGSDERATEIASEFIRLKVDVIVTSGGVLLGAKRVTTAIPIVFAIANDPVGSGFVASLARPGGNITGLSLQSTDIATKRLELLREILPGIRRLAILVNGGNPGAALELGEVGKQPEPLDLKSALSKSDERKILCPPSRC
jgi:putative tryptophan/tyrosine transport system substrate-binding protein